VFAHEGGETSFTVEGSYVSDGLYDFRYTPTIAGLYTLSVTINGAHVAESPFALDVRPTTCHGPLVVAAGTATASTNATTSFTITARDRFNNQLRLGGDHFVVRLTGPGVVSAIPHVIRATVEDGNNGVYTASYFAPRSGTYSIDVKFADDTQRGLLGEYFPNMWLQDEPAEVVVDPVVDFTWPRNSDLVTDGWGTIYNSVRWTGYVELPASEYFTFTIEADDGARLHIANELVVDRLEGPPGVSSGQLSFQAVAGSLYEVNLEYRQLTDKAVVRLLWESPSTPLAVVPQDRLFPRGIDILNNPFHMEASAQDS